MQKGLFFIAIFIFSVNYSTAQNLIYGEAVGGTVIQNNLSITSPWCGGINSTHIQKADLDDDGIEDLVIYDRNTRTLKTFINESATPNTMAYRYEPKYAKNFPEIFYYIILKDYNCDGIMDLFHRGVAGISVNKGAYVNGELTFTFFKELYFPGSFGPVNAYVQPNDIPSIVDIDRDGDLDFFSFGVLGAYVPFYKNMRVENGDPCDSLNIIQQATCWGNMYQGFAREHTLNATCKGGSGSQKKTRHTGNCLLHIDIDGDSDYDLLGGNVSFTDVQLLINGGSLNSADITSQDTLFDADNHQLELNTWPASQQIDIDNDGLQDLVFTPHLDDISSANYSAVALYKNIGTNILPVYDWINDSTLINNMIDVGSFSYPSLYDYDKDGKKDLFVGGAGYFNTITKTRDNKLAYYRNTSTLNNISFELITRDFISLSSKNYKGIYPTFGDVTGDGIDDLVLGNDSGYVAVYRNTAVNNTTQANFIFETDSIPGIDVGNLSFPAIYDYNQDGKSDLILGNETGFIALFQDSSSTSTTDLKLVNNNLGGIKAGSNFTFLGYGAPFIGYIDSTNETALLVGTADGTIEVYDSIDQNYGPIPRTDSMYSTIQVAYRAVPTVADLDGNGTLDMIVGNQNGGLQLYTLNQNSSVGLNDISRGQLSFDVYPNPTKDVLTIQLSNLDKKSQISIEIMDLAGRKIRKETFDNNPTLRVSTNELLSGIYFIRVEYGNSIGVKKFIKE